MGKKVDIDQLIGARDVARILGLTHRNISQYARSHPDLPKPVIDLGDRQARLWLRPDVERYARALKRSGG